jgi:hypothetical protein
VDKPAVCVSSRCGANGGQLFVNFLIRGALEWFAVQTDNIKKSKLEFFMK